MTSALAPLMPIVTPHFRKGAIDLALIKHQAIAVAVGLAVRRAGDNPCEMIEACSWPGTWAMSPVPRHVLFLAVLTTVFLS